MVVTNRWSKKKYEVWEISEKNCKIKAGRWHYNRDFKKRISV